MEKVRDKHLTDDASMKRTICEVHREIYDIIYELDNCSKKEQILDLLEEAFLMAKKMNDKLFEYKKDWDAGFFQPNSVYYTMSKKLLRGERQNRKDT